MEEKDTGHCIYHHKVNLGRSWSVITFTCRYLFSPGVVITELQKRGGLSEEAYHKVGQ